MAKKTWIYIKCTFGRDPKHRIRIGESVWLFMHMIDLVDWETGIISEWRDEEEAANLSMPVSTLRHQRRKLEAAEYIQCTQGLRAQSIKIMKWISPRDFSGKVINLPEPDPGEPEPADPGNNPLTPPPVAEPESQGDNPLTPSELEEPAAQGDNPLTPEPESHGYNHGDNHGYNHGDNHPASSTATLPLDSLPLPLPITQLNKEEEAEKISFFEPLSPALSEALKDLGIYRPLWAEVSARLREDWLEKDIFALISWMQSTKPDSPSAAGGFVARLREGTKAPGKYYGFAGRASGEDLVEWFRGKEDSEDPEAEELAEPELADLPAPIGIPTEILNLWGVALDVLKSRFSKATFDTWIQPTRIASFENDRLRIYCPDKYAQTWLSERTVGRIVEDLFRAKLARPISIEFVAVGDAVSAD